MANLTKSVEEFFLSIFKITVLFIMGLALMSILVLIAIGINQYFQSSKEPIPAQKAPNNKYIEKEIKIDDLKQFLIEQEKNRNRQNEFDQSSARQKTSLLFLEDAAKLYNCSINFAEKSETPIQETQEPELQKVEELRDYIARTANGVLNGEEWVKAMVDFTCTALSDISIIEMKKEGKIKRVFYPILNFHMNAWEIMQEEKIRVQKAKIEFEQREYNRVASERASEELRVAKAKAFAINCLVAAAGAFGLFMILALYLLGAKIENNLRAINYSIRANILAQSQLNAHQQQSPDIYKTE
ncbi:MAG: hypothetical protein HQK70_02765 [Desulfamplus sp.]|nr:hypothetical protein [Desulfamplus sp.]